MKLGMLHLFENPVGKTEHQVIQEHMELMYEAEALGFDSVWPAANETQITSNLLQAMVHSGSYLVGVFDGSIVVGASFAFPAIEPEIHLHSHMTAFIDTHRDLGLGKRVTGARYADYSQLRDFCFHLA